MSSASNAIAGGWADAADNEDPWGAFEEPVSPPVPIPVSELTSPSIPTGPPLSAASPARTLHKQVGKAPRVAMLSPSESSSPRATPLASPAPSERAASPVASVAAIPALSTAGMTKEEKAAEMARRKEERRQVRSSFFFVMRLFLGLYIMLTRYVVGFQRIAQLKEQKKNAAGPKA
jgi:SCY1-like protein 1